MRRRIVIVIAAILVCAAAVWAGAPSLTQAQDGFTAADAIALAAADPVFASGLEALDNWSARAYYTHNQYGIWYVQFLDGNGDEVGWANVSLTRGRVYVAESHIGATETLSAQAAPLLRDFVANNADILDLVPDAADRIAWHGYDGWNDWWAVYIDVGQNSIVPLIRFEGGKLSLESPVLVGITFENMMNYDEWHEAQGSQAASIAFLQAEISSALRPHDGWDAQYQPVNDGSDGLWWVGYYAGERLVAEATVNVLTSSIEWFQVNG